MTSPNAASTIGFPESLEASLHSCSLLELHCQVMLLKEGCDTAFDPFGSTNNAAYTRFQQTSKTIAERGQTAQPRIRPSTKRTGISPPDAR